MRNFTVTVRKLTDTSLMREACEMTFLGKSQQSLLSIYKSEHSPVRTQMFWITFKDIDLSSATQILRHNVGSVPFQLSCREDRKGNNQAVPERIDSILTKLKKIHEESKHGDLDWIDFEEMEQVYDELEYIAENTDRHTPVNLGLMINAQSLIDMSKVRFCLQAHKDTRTYLAAMREKIREIDPELAEMMVAKCVYRNGLCGEPRCCGFNSTSAFKKDLGEYLSNFSDKQKGICK